MKLKEKVGNISVYIKQNTVNDYTVSFYNGLDCIMSEVYFTSNIEAAIEDLFRKMDTYTREWLYLNLPIMDIVKLSENTYRCNDDYFCRIDNTKYFKHLVEPTTGWVVDKNGNRIIDR